MANNDQEEIKKRLEKLPSPASPFKRIFYRILLILGLFSFFLLIILILLWRRG